MTRTLEEIVGELTLMDDAFFHKLAEHPGFCQEVLQVILQKPALEVVEVIPQMNLKNLIGRSVYLDVFCKDSAGNYYNIEIQKTDSEDHQKRVRFHGSCMDALVSRKGSCFAELPETYVIYISDFDLFRNGEAVYYIDRVKRDDGMVVENGFHEIYVNTVIDDGSDISELMKLFRSSGIPEDKRFPEVCRLIRYYKGKEGCEDMCDLIEEYAREYAEEVAKEVTKKSAMTYAKNLLMQGLGLDIIRKAITDLSEEELIKLQAEVMK